MNTSNLTGTRSGSKSIAIAITAVLLLALSAAVAQAATNKSAMTKGAKWIANKNTPLSAFPGTGFRADAVSALAAARKSGAKIKSSANARFIADLEDNAASYTVTAGATSKVLLAVVAAGKNPRCFGPAGTPSDPNVNKLDLYGLLQTYYKSNGKYGETGFDQALSMLALKAAHQKIPAKAIAYAMSKRSDGGWNFALSSAKGDGVETTGLMIEALRAAGVSKKSKSLRAAYKWMTYQRNSDSGYNPDAPAGETQANTTAYAIRAGDAMGFKTDKSKRALRALQKRGGNFRSSPTIPGVAGIATSDAVIALSGRHYPVVSRAKAAKPGC